MQDNLLALQSTAKAIRNPFGQDFTVTWDGQKVTLKGDAEWKTFIGPLATHIAKHLYSLVLNATHDKNVRELKSSGRTAEARKYSVPSAIKNKIWLAITGTDHPDFNGVDFNATNTVDQMDFSILAKDMGDIDRIAETSPTLTNVSQIVQQASDEAVAALTGETVDGAKVSRGSDNSASVRGGVALGAPTPKDTMPLDPIETIEAPVAESPAPQPEPQAETVDQTQTASEAAEKPAAPANSAEGEFADLKEL